MQVQTDRQIRLFETVPCECIPSFRENRSIPTSPGEGRTVQSCYQKSPGFEQEIVIPTDFPEIPRTTGELTPRVSLAIICSPIHNVNQRFPWVFDNSRPSTSGTIDRRCGTTQSCVNERLASTYFYKTTCGNTSSRRRSSGFPRGIL